MSELHPLKQWLEERGSRQNWAASRLGMSEEVLSRALNGHQRLSARLCVAIEALTDHGVASRDIVAWQERVVPKRQALKEAADG